ncbi:MAG: hypothetical protein HC853_06625 [Anaerolineae bacterium]|nr:hypothetical protein [Anaerolineae bacterium]
MSQNWLKVEHFRQEEVAGCLPACAQMALQYLGVQVGQPELAALFEVDEYGAPASRIKRLEKLGAKVLYESDASFKKLTQWLEQHVPPIVFVQTGALAYWHEDTAHAVVVIGITESDVILNDPYFADAPKACPLDRFLLAWDDFGNRYAVVMRK